VLAFEGERHSRLRRVRAVKNRYGPSDEVGCFDLGETGIVGLPDPSGLFLVDRAEAVAGTCVTVTLEGRRALPVEVQALVVDTTAPNPRRVVSGVDGARVAMLIAVLEKRCRIKLSDKEIYVSTVGGIRLAEPGSDLAIALAIASAARDKPLSRTLAAIGEISLAGEVRAVAGAKQRAAEGARLGYRTIVDAEAGSIQTAESIAFAARGLEVVDAPAF
jgi:DNA repair protein RadA/Sms